jgi:hypothetical protein
MDSCNFEEGGDRSGGRIARFGTVSREKISTGSRSEILKSMALERHDGTLADHALDTDHLAA